MGKHTPDLSHIVEDLRQLARPIELFTPDPENVRKHDERSYEATRASLEEYGQRKPIVVRKEGMIVKAGNGTLEAAKRLGWKHIAAVVVDEDAMQAAGYALADNRTGELSEWDYGRLADNITELLKDGVAIDSLGWSQEEIDALTASLDSPSDDDWADAFEDAGNTSTVDGRKGVTFVMSTDEHAQLMEHLKRYDVNKNKAIVAWLRASLSDQ